MKKIKHFTFSILLLFGAIFTSKSQEAKKTENVFRVNFLNPAVEYEWAAFKNGTLSFSTGIGYNGGYPELTQGGSGFIYIIAPFAEVQNKWFYNFQSRENKGKNINNNSANFVSLRVLAKGKSLADNVTRKSDNDVAVGPSWGLQRVYGKNFHLLFDIGPVFYFDAEGNSGFFPINVQLNLGFDFKKR